VPDKFERPPLGVVMAAPAPLRGSRRARLLGGASTLALPASMALALGVSLSSGASAQTTISGSHNTTVNLATYATGNPFTFTTGATVTAVGNAVYGSNAAPWTLTNNGTLTGGNFGISLTSQSTVTNTGTITGQLGVDINSVPGGSVTNQAGGTIYGQTVGISLYHGVNGTSTVTNAGTITGHGLDAVCLCSGGSVINQAIGVMLGGTVGVLANGVGTVTNAGSISGGFQGVVLSVGGSVTNQSGGVIASYYAGILVTGAAGTVTNAGTITATSSLGGEGVFLNAGGSVTNQAGGGITGFSDGVGVTGAAGTVTNTGTITGTHRYGVDLGAGGSVTNQAGGTIIGAVDGVRVSGAAGTVINAGTITGKLDSVGFLGTGANVLTLQTGSVLNGTASGSTAAGATTALVLQGTGTANNNFVNFTTLDVQASGTWALGGTSTIGSTTVESGTLVVTGNLALTNTLTVNAGSTLAGTGTVGTANGTFINSGATLHGGLPGTIGTLNVNGNLAFNPGSILATTIAPPGSNSRVNVGGTATPTGGTVQVMATAPLAHAQTFTILTANTINGAFGSVVETAFAPDPVLTQDAHNVFLTVGASSFAAALPDSATVNQVKVAKGIDAALGGPVPAAFLTLGNLPAANLPNILTQLAGENATGSQQTTFAAMGQFLGVLLDPFIGGRGEAGSSSGATPFAEEGASAYAADGKKRSKSERDAYAMFTKAPPASSFDARWSVWAAGFGGSQTTDGNATLGSNTATSRVFAGAVGADYRFSPFTIAGFALAGGGTNFSVANSGTGRSDLFQAGAFVRHTVGQAYISGALAYGWQDVTTDRTVMVAGLDRLHAEFNANAFSGRIEGGYRFVTPWIGGVGITPYAAGQFTTFDLPAYAESVLAGSNNFALAYGSKSVTDTRSEFGIRTDKSFAMQNAILTLRGRAAWAHDFNPDRTIAATFQTLPGASFVVGGAAQAHDSALTTASVEMKWMNGWSVAASFEGEFSDVTRSYAGKGIVRYNW
jgi:uncharacterized protein with beta-barrel porin domain